MPGKIRNALAIARHPIKKYRAWKQSKKPPIKPLPEVTSTGTKSQIFAVETSEKKAKPKGKPAGKKPVSKDQRKEVGKQILAVIAQNGAKNAEFQQLATAKFPGKKPEEVYRKLLYNAFIGQKNDPVSTLVQKHFQEIAGKMRKVGDRATVTSAAANQITRYFIQILRKNV